MSKRSPFNIKKSILTLIKSSPLTYAQLERKVNTGFVTIKDNCEELQSYGFVKIEKKDKHERSGRPYFQVRITEEGLKFLKKD
jgi:predicted transcriptional regulator